MAEGKIKWFNAQKGYGFIERKGGDDLFIHINQWRGPSGSIPQEEVRVTFEVGKDRKGKLEAQNVYPADTSTEQPTLKSNRTAQYSYRFLNPYNFVRYLSQDRRPNHILGNCPPPPHDRYLGLTGRITCQVKAVTPLFISDSHDVQENNGHKSYRFFQYDDQPALPATSLRGMIRSVFEAVTNSCFAKLTDKPLSYHFDSKKSPWLVPSRVEKDETGWRLRLLTGTSALQIGSEPRDKQYAAWLHRYWPMKPSGTLQKPPQNSKTRLFQARTQQGHEVDLKGLDHGQECFALLQETAHPHPRIKFWDVIAVNADPNALRINKQGQIVAQGWLCLTNQNIEPKHSERFFFRSSSNRIGPETIDLPESIQKAYEDLITDYQDRHYDKIQKRRQNHQAPEVPLSNDPAFSRFVYQTDERKLCGGELVYAMLRGTVTNPQVEFIVPVSVPRVGYEHSIGDLLPGYLHLCANYSFLCPACRLFGWVHENPPENATNVAYAGRVRFSHGTPVESTIQKFTEPITLAILSSPKPTTTLFYLLNQAGEPADVTYDTLKARLRGRKTYRHHGPSLREKEYQRNPKADQNRTVRDVLQAGSTFIFTIDFENLAEEELGALLWALEFESDGTMFHRLGYAKPLGFGSVEIKVTQLEVMQPGQRYTRLKSWDDGWHEAIDKKDIWKKQFKQMMEELYNQSFNQLETIQDLQALLGEPVNPLPIHYPRCSEAPSDDEENFKWFGDNNEPLPLAPKDVNGFTLLKESKKKRGK